jgi:hypothetical protein
VKKIKLETHLDRFWEVEAVEQSTLTPEQQQCEEQFVTQTTQQADGRYVVRLPIKEEFNQLGASRHSSEKKRCHRTKIGK